MKYDDTLDKGPEHSEVSGLLPWYVNGRIDEFDRQRVELHVSRCPVCRQDMALERRVYQGMAADAGVEYMPMASLKRLLAKLDGIGLESTPVVQEKAQSAPTPVIRAVDLQRRRGAPWARGLMAASIILMTVIVGLTATGSWTPLRSLIAPSDYHTVTTSVPRPSDEVIRAVFSPSLSLVQL
jgi:anti-sigma factor RsiW